MKNPGIAFAFFMTLVFALKTSNAKTQNTCIERVVEILEDNPIYQNYLEEGSQSGIYKASKLMYQQTLKTCGASLSAIEKETIREQIKQLDQAVDLLEGKANGLRFDFSDPASNTPRYGSQNINPTRPVTPKSRTTPQYKSSGAPGTSSPAY